MIKKIAAKIKNRRQNDPVYSCQQYKTHGCAHVDGMLCNLKTCKDK